MALSGFILIDSKGKIGFIPSLIPDHSLTNPLSFPAIRAFMWWFFIAGLLFRREIRVIHYKKKTKTYGVENFVASAAVLLVIQCPHPLSRWALRQQRDEFTVCPPVAMQTGECGARAAQEHNWRGGCCRLGTVRALFTDKRRGAHNPSLHLHKFTICCCLYFSPHSGAFAQLLIKSHQVSFKRGFIPSCFPFHIILLNTL